MSTENPVSNMTVFREATPEYRRHAARLQGSRIGGFPDPDSRSSRVCPPWQRNDQDLQTCWDNRDKTMATAAMIIPANGSDENNHCFIAYPQITDPIVMPA